MFKIQTLNKISSRGLDLLPHETYEYASELANPDGALKPGMYVEAALESSETRPVLTVPAASVQEFSIGRVVFAMLAAVLVWTASHVASADPSNRKRSRPDLSLHQATTRQPGRS
mgnify:CR=1 FL=1